jgi:hypothetical protein
MKKVPGSHGPDGYVSICGDDPKSNVRIESAAVPRA